eukprot:5383028-Amphidinium_carterae.1
MDSENVGTNEEVELARERVKERVQTGRDIPSTIKRGNIKVLRNGLCCRDWILAIVLSLWHTPSLA